MRLSVDHRTTYRFSAPQRRLIQLLRLTPGGTDGQAVANWGIHVDCDARMRHGRDGFGNRTTMLYVDGPIDSIEIEVSGEVLTEGSDGILHGSVEPLPPPLFLRSTPLTEADAAITDFAHAARAGTSDAVERLGRINAALFAHFEADRGRPASGRKASTAFTLVSATPRDMAHIFVASARATGIPARYVSGYSSHALGGEHLPTPHGWAEAFVEGWGWVAFDPSTGARADDAYVRVAVALDAAGAAVVAGSRLGEGDEQMDVDVTVAPAAPQD